MELIVRRDGEEAHVAVTEGDDHFEVTVDDRTHEVQRAVAVGTVRTLVVEGRQYEVSVRALGGGRYRVTTSWGVDEVEVVDALTHLARQTHQAAAGPSSHRVSAYMPGKVVAVLVEEGARVEAGQGLVVLEAMKMENEITAESAGRVRRIFVEPGQPVEGGDPLFEIE